MKIVVWSMNSGSERRLSFTQQLVRGLQQDPDELHIVQEFSVTVTDVEIPTDGLKTNEYTIVVLAEEEEYMFDLTVDGVEELEIENE
jgi:hypothetical protein